MSSSDIAISVKPLPVRVLKHIDGSSDISIEDMPIRFGLYSDKFARFMSELMSSTSIMSKMSSSKYRYILEMTDVAVQLSNPSSLSICEKTRVSVSEGKLFKNQFGEIGKTNYEKFVGFVFKKAWIPFLKAPVPFPSQPLPFPPVRPTSSPPAPPPDGSVSPPRGCRKTGPRREMSPRSRTCFSLPC